MTTIEAQAIDKAVNRCAFQRRMAERCSKHQIRRHNARQAEKCRIRALELTFYAFTR